MSGHLAHLRAALDAHAPATIGERRSLERIRSLVGWLPRPLDEDADPTHVTASAIVLDEHERVLMHRHKRLGIWLQPGGHIDPGEAPEAAAVREVLEETGVVASHPSDGPRIVHVDVHEGPRGHVHLDLRYLLHASSDCPLAPDEHESQEVDWLPAEEATGRSDVGLGEAIATALWISR